VDRHAANTHGTQGEPSLEVLQATTLPPPQHKTSLGYGIVVRLEQKMEVLSSEGGGGGGSSKGARILSVLAYRHRALGKALVTGDEEGALRFYARNGTLIKVSQSIGLQAQIAGREGGKKEGMVITFDCIQQRS